MCELKHFCIKSGLVPSDGAYQEIYHVGLVVPQCFDSVEHIHRALVPQHLTHNTDCTESPTSSTSVPEKRA